MVAWPSSSRSKAKHHLRGWHRNNEALILARREGLGLNIPPQGIFRVTLLPSTRPHLKSHSIPILPSLRDRACSVSLRES